MSDYRYSINAEGRFVEVPPIDELCVILKEKFNNEERRIKYLEEENKKLKDEFYQKEEVQKIRSKYEQMRLDYYRGFPISKEEQENIQKWEKEHIYTKHQSKIIDGAIGGAFTYKFIPTSIGIIGTIECGCGDKFTFQDL